MTTAMQRTLTLVAFCAAFTAAAFAADAPTYQAPPDKIAAIVDAPPTPAAFLSPDNKWFLILGQPNLPPIEELAAPEVKVAGVRINPRNNGPSRGGFFNSLTLKNVATGAEREITGLPADPRMGSLSWSPDSQRIAFRVSFDDHIELWTADVESARAKKLAGNLNMASGRAFEWLSDSETLVGRFIVDGRGDAPAEPTVPAGPVIEENLGRVAPARTYQDLLENPHDEALFDYYLTAQVQRISLDGSTMKLGEPGIIVRADPSPDGRYLLVERIHRPYSYLVPMGRFPRDFEIWDLNGKLVKQLAQIPLAEEIPIAFAAVRTGPRSINWRSDAPATVYWVEAQDKGDPRNEVDVRDTVFTLAAPFDEQPAELADLALRYGGVTWGSDDLALVSEWWWQTRKARQWMVKPGDPAAEPQILIDRSFEDRYNDPGSPVMTDTEWGTYVLLTDDGGKSLYMSGSGASPEGDRPFLDKLDLATKETERLWQSEAPHYEYFVDFLDMDAGTVVTRRESIDEPPNYFVRHLDGGELSQITHFPHPTPELKGVQKELIRYERSDGVTMTATLYLPPGYDAERDGPLPMLMWAYPQEFKSADAAGQVTDSPYRFVRIGWYSPMLWLVHGYAVLDDPTMPIVAENPEDEPNDRFLEQLRASAQAAVDEVVRRGVADPQRIAIGGHSYGAFMTANLLAHTDLFRTGIARSGAYNRTLTPFGFQSEERSLWEAPDVYFTMSPFMHADKVNEPILLIHGEADNNTGTYPMQSERYYNALKGHGAVARLVMLPHESHGYRARESVMHMLWEMTTWMDEYVKNAE